MIQVGMIILAPVQHIPTRKNSERRNIATSFELNMGQTV